MSYLNRTLWCLARWVISEQEYSAVIGIHPQLLHSFTHLHSEPSIMCYNTKRVHIWRHGSVNIDILISYNDVITRSIASSLYPIIIWTPADLTVMKPPWPWRPASVINHSVFWNTSSLLMPIRGLNADAGVAVNLNLSNCRFICGVVNDLVGLNQSSTITLSLQIVCFILCRMQMPE